MKGKVKAIRGQDKTIRDKEETLFGRIDKRRWNLPNWYLFGVFALNMIGIILYMFSLWTEDFVVLGLLGFTNIVIISVWLIINIYMIIFLASKKYSGMNFIFPIYFVFIDLLIISLFFLAWSRGMYVSERLSVMITLFSTFFELSFAGIFLYVKYRRDGNISLKEKDVPQKRRPGKRLKKDGQPAKRKARRKKHSR